MGICKTHDLYRILVKVPIMGTLTPMGEKPFIDMLHLVDRGVGRPPLNAGRVVSTDQAGRVEWLTVKFLPNMGSYDTRINVRVGDDGSLEMRGNPSRYDREDNLFGIGISESREVMNEILRKLGQPVLTEMAYVSRMDITKNYAFETIEKMRAYIALTQNRAKKTYRIGDTVSYGSAKYRKVVIYPKAAELRQHNKKNRDSRYREMLAEYCDKVALLRVEQRFGHDYWYRNRQDSYIQKIDDLQVITMFEKRIDEIIHEVETENYADLSVNEVGVLLMWAKGLRPKERMSKNTYYRYRRKIKKVTGHDIGDDNNVVEMPKKPIKINITEAVPPPGYRYHPKDERVEGNENGSG